MDYVQNLRNLDYMKYVPEKVKEVLLDRSMFQLLCLSYEIKAYLINAFAILSAFIYSNDPIEAQIILGEMKARNSRISNLDSLPAGESANT